MSSRELIRTKKELGTLADLLAEEIRSQDDIVSRYIRIVYDSANFINGQTSSNVESISNLNKENMSQGTYSQTGVDDLLPYSIDLLKIARDLKKHTFDFHRKGIELPRDQQVFVESIPKGINFYDNEFREFTKTHPNTRIKRTLIVEQRIVVNSKGGKSIQVVPFFAMSYSQGYAPILTHRTLSVACNSYQDIKRLIDLIQYFPDPTPERRITRKKSFSETFNELYKISELRYGNLPDVGIPLSELYDVIMISGVPAHEIFGHHFEEPVRNLDFGESGTFKFGQNIRNKDIFLLDNPQQKIQGFRVWGFAHFDAYGRKREPRIHIKDGKVVGFLGSEYVDSEKLESFLGLEKSSFVGNASQYSDGMFPMPRMSCTVLDGKSEEIDLEGKILVVAHEGSTDPRKKTYEIKSYEAYVIKGEEPQRVIPLSITGGINQALANISLLKHFTYQTGVCSEPEPIYYPQPRDVAQVPASQFTRNQVWREQQIYPLPISDAHLNILIKDK